MSNSRAPYPAVRVPARAQPAPSPQAVHRRPTSNTHAPEVRERTLRIVRDGASEQPSRWTAVRIAQAIGCTHGALLRQLEAIS